ncbi:heavy metal sensor histidine kinase [Thioalkalivibrio sp.]|uniref:heavy metal sensor histidine kinase n=1 Tax=Thioalkalivibrio sp. TaxID=2093813 RepID=UPI0012D6F16E|nr:heavy metal sensor histidine kinase [Thioalkalivibrio sp.]TVP77126.1 MAG: HAMP domain-containing protein [Thioalkalivibrio sp.]
MSAAPPPALAKKRHSRRRPLSLTARLAILFALMAASLLLGVGILLERAVDSHFDELDAYDLDAKMAVIGHLIETTDDEEALELLPRRLKDAFAGHENLAVLLRDADRVVVFGTRLSSFEPEQLTGPVVGGTERVWVRDGRHFISRLREFQLPLPEAPTLHAALALDITHHVHFLDELRIRLWFGVSVAAAFAALLGWLAARQGLAPLTRVTATARRLSAEQLGQRISQDDAPAEVRELAEAFNEMLDRLEASFRRLSDFSADIAHELRTPVSNLMTETQVALTRARSAEDYRETLHSNLEEFDRLARMISDMLFLAKADNGLLPRPAEVVTLGAEARALLEFYEALADEQGVRLRLSGEASVVGDRLMLRQAIANLLSNALRHTAAGNTVEIEISRGKNQAILKVCNPGAVIPAERLPLLFDRFHRADDSRSGRGEGAGLGLAITRSIVETHGGHVEVQSADGFTTFSLHLPLGPSLPFHGRQGDE